jgi:hypothetical protein
MAISRFARISLTQPQEPLARILLPPERSRKHCALVSNGKLMPENSSTPRTAPTIRCHESTAAALGAVLISHPSDTRKLGLAWIPVRGHDGSCWAWPLEQGFVAAVERHSAASQVDPSDR